MFLIFISISTFFFMANFQVCMRLRVCVCVFAYVFCACAHFVCMCEFVCVGVHFSVSI